MNDLKERIENTAATVVTNQKWSEETSARYHAMLMRLLEEAKREFDQWPEWKKQYSITTRTY